MKTIDTITVEQYDPNKHIHLAIQIAEAQQAEHPQMFPLTPEVMASHPLAYIAHQMGLIAVGYNAITNHFSDQFIEIGGLYVMPNFRKIGVPAKIKSKLYPHASKMFVGHKAVIFTNPDSVSLNLRYGAKVAEISDVPQGALNLCKTECDLHCTLPEGSICCDTILSMTPEQLMLNEGA